MGLGSVKDNKRGEKVRERQTDRDRDNMKDRYLVFAYHSGDYIWQMGREKQSIWFINNDSLVHCLFPER